MEIPALSQALLGSVALRDRVVVLRFAPGVLGAADLVESVARTLALLRALDLRVIVVHDPRAQGEGAAADATHALIAAVARYEQRAIAILPHGVVRAIPHVPFPLIDQALLIQLCSLRYIPILLLPALDDEARPAELTAEQVAACIGKFLDAALVVHLHVGPTEAPPQVEGEPRAIAVGAAATDTLLAELLLKASIKRGGT
jgi:hypothetical protein